VKINIQIERLVLDRVPIERQQRHLVKAAVEAELSRLLGANGLADNLMSGGAVSSLSAPTIQLGKDNSPIKLGQQIGRAINGGLGR
jgi:hypothetical protein